MNLTFGKTWISTNLFKNSITKFTHEFSLVKKIWIRQSRSTKKNSQNARNLFIPLVHLKFRVNLTPLEVCLQHQVQFQMNQRFSTLSSYQNKMATESEFPQSPIFSDKIH